MIYLLTGQNGHGKTLRAMQLALEFKEAGREVFLCRVNGVDYEKTGFHELDAFSNWQQCPDGSVIVVDECWEDIPARAVGKALPEWEKQLAVHRHRGFDFILICQAGTQISTHVRALVHEHTHVRRKWGSQKAMLLTWDRFQPSTASTAEVRDARKKVFVYPKSIFGMYKSATVHTAKRNLPWQMFAIPVLIILIIGIGWLFFHRFSHRGDAAKESVEAVKGPAGAKTTKVEEKPKIKTGADYLVQFQPRINSLPWSAPWHDDAKPRADPDIFCIKSEVKGCSCYTEQITPLTVPVQQCMQIARNGVYNPFRASFVRGLDPQNPGLRDPEPGRKHVGELASDGGGRRSLQGEKETDRDSVPRVVPRDRSLGVPPPAPLSSYDKRAGAGG